MTFGKLARMSAAAGALFAAAQATHEAAAWNELHAHFDTRRINHSVEYANDNACTNQAKSSFSRMRRARLPWPESAEAAVWRRASVNSPGAATNRRIHGP